MMNLLFYTLLYSVAGTFAANLVWYGAGDRSSLTFLPICFIIIFILIFFLLYDAESSLKKIRSNNQSVTDSDNSKSIDGPDSSDDLNSKYLEKHEDGLLTDID